MWGPYNDNGDEYSSCDIDICNGAWVGGTYGYVSTKFHPYIMSCWGPGSNSTKAQTCSMNPRVCGSVMNI